MNPDALALAEAQAAKDADLLTLLEKRDADVKPEPVRMPNRAERRAMVAKYKAAVRAIPKQRPLVNPTVVPKSKRRRRKS